MEPVAAEIVFSEKPEKENNESSTLSTSIQKQVRESIKNAYNKKLNETLEIFEKKFNEIIKDPLKFINVNVNNYIPSYQHKYQYKDVGLYNMAKIPDIEQFSYKSLEDGNYLKVYIQLPNDEKEINEINFNKLCNKLKNKVHTLIRWDSGYDEYCSHIICNKYYCLEKEIYHYNYNTKRKFKHYIFGSYYIIYIKLE